MNITIASPDGKARSIEISKAMEAHFNIPINHANTILKQINDGMYSRWFADKNDLVVIDFGANVGLTALYFLPACKALVCVEPTPSHYELLCELLEANKGDGLIRMCQEALTETRGEFIFATGHSTENKLTTENGHGTNKIKVKGLTLEDYILLAPAIIDFIKIDIEGGEIFALSQEQIDLSKGKVRTFFVECHPTNNYGMDACREELKRRFELAGYTYDEIDYQTFTATYEC